MNRLLGPLRGALPDDLGRIASGSLLNLVAASVSAIATFLLYLVAARLYDPDEVGAFLIGVAVFTILITVSQLGGQVGFVRFIPRLRALGRFDEIQAALITGMLPIFVVSCVAAVVLFATAQGWADIFGQGGDGLAVSRHLRMMAPFVPAGALTMAMAFASQGFGTMLPAAAAEKIGRPIGQLLLIVATAGLGAEALGVSYGLPYVFVLLVLLVWVRRLSTRAAKGQEPKRVSRELVKDFWSFALPRGLASTFQVAILWMDTVLLGVLASTSDAGIYSVATRYLTVGHLAIGAMLQATGPRLSSILTTGDHERAASVFRTTTWWIICTVWPLYLVVVLFHEPLLSIFGSEYVAAGGPLVVLAGAMMLAAACGPVDVVLLMAGKSWLSLVNWGGGLVVNIGLNFLLIPRIGMMGAAIAWMASIIVRNVIPLVEVRSMMHLDPFGTGYFRGMAASLGTFGVVGLALRIALGPTWMGLLILLTTMVPCYCLLIWRWRKQLYVPAADSVTALV